MNHVITSCPRWQLAKGGLQPAHSSAELRSQKRGGNPSALVEPRDPGAETPGESRGQGPRDGPARNVRGRVSWGSPAVGLQTHVMALPSGSRL